MSLAIVKNHFVEYRDLFRKMFFHAQPQIAAPIIVVRKIPRNREYPPGLFLQTRSDQRCLGQSALVRMRQAVDIGRDPIEKLQISVLKENTAKGFLDEMGPFAAHRQQLLQGAPVDAMLIIGDRGTRKD